MRTADVPQDEIDDHTAPSARKRRPWLASGVILALIAALAVYFVWDPSHLGIFPRCVWYSATGSYCPGCGMQRALHQLLHGQLIEAASYNLLVVLAAPALIYNGLGWVVYQYSGRRLPGVYLSGQVCWAICMAVFAFWLGRNLPVWPLEWLAPGDPPPLPPLGMFVDFGSSLG